MKLENLLDRKAELSKYYELGLKFEDHEREPLNSLIKDFNKSIKEEINVIELYEQTVNDNRELISLLERQHQTLRDLDYISENLGYIHTKERNIENRLREVLRPKSDTHRLMFDFYDKLSEKYKD